MKGRWDAVEVGVDEWFLGMREGEGPGDGYDPFIDLGDCNREMAERIAACLNVCRGISTKLLLILAPLIEHSQESDLDKIVRGN